MSKWFLGNIHCHTTNSDGTDSPEYVANFYKNANFNFVCITDHNHLTQPEETKIINDKDFIVIPGAEFTTVSQEKPFGDGVTTQTHLNGVGLKNVIKPDQIYQTTKNSFQSALDQINFQNAFSMINHPNWQWSFKAEQILSAKGAHAFEVFNGSFTSNNNGRDGHESTDEMWDKILSAGQLIYGAATDDCHVFSKYIYNKDRPLSGFIGVEAEELTVENIVNSLKAGRFYATTRIELNHFYCDGKKYCIDIKPFGQISFSTKFIGDNGKILAVVDGHTPEYKIKGNEKYVRAVIECSDNLRAWTQPYMIP